MNIEKQNNGGAGTGGLGYGLAMVQDQPWTLESVLTATGGRLLGKKRQVVFRSVCTDTRSLEPGDLFLALTGENFDGAAFAAEAAAKGAAGLVLEGPPVSTLPVPVVLVEDTLKALGDLAAWRRGRMADLRVLAITGSSGKTTVKEMTAAILARKFPILKTSGNFNNLVGLPLSLLPVDSRYRIAVLEMGMNRPGEIARMTEIAVPELACINNIQSAHLQGLDDLTGVARAKGELFAGLESGATMVVNLDDPLVREMAERYPQTRITFGLNRQALVRATRIGAGSAKGISFTLHLGLEQTRVRLRCVGRHNVSNALAAAALAHGVGVGLDGIRLGLEEFTPYDKRLQIDELPGGLRLVNDTYNANPASMLAALETVQGLRRHHRAVVVLGDMLELGGESRAAHRFIGAAVARLNFDYLLAFGTYAGELVEAAREAGLSAERCLVFASKAKIVDFLKDLQDSDRLGSGDWLLVKGSRGVRMETVIADMKEAR